MIINSVVIIQRQPFCLALNGCTLFLIYPR